MNKNPSFQAILYRASNPDYVEDIAECEDPETLVEVIVNRWGVKEGNPRDVTVQSLTPVLGDTLEYGDKLDVQFTAPACEQAPCLCVRTAAGPVAFVDWCKAQMPYTGPGTYTVELVHTRVHKMTTTIQASSYEEAQRLANEGVSYTKTAFGWKLDRDEVEVTDVSFLKK